MRELERKPWKDNGKRAKKRGDRKEEKQERKKRDRPKKSTDQKCTQNHSIQHERSQIALKFTNVI
jgi:hypothetical protein